jgi:N-acyl-phosphatidylethanolamine-hydrolysing phospholipase D
MPAHHRPGGGFRNPWPDSQPAGFRAFLKWVLWERLTGRRPPDGLASLPRPVAPSFVTPRAPADLITITWVGHASFLLQLGGRNVLIDPMWSERASPVRFVGPRRVTPPGVEFGALPPIDVVLQSHDHYDHLDDITVRRLVERYPQAVWVAALGVGAFIRQRGGQDVRELDWWDSLRLGGVTISATPAQHFSGRSFAARDETLWCGWVIRAGGRAVWFAGDTGYHPDFGLIGERQGPFDLALVPVGAYEPRWFMRPVHMNPEDAVRAFIEVRRAASGVSPRTMFVPMHWGTFKLTDEPLEEPPARTRAAWVAAGLPSDDLWILNPGETRTLPAGLLD